MNAIAGLYPGYFSLVMATGIVSIAALFEGWTPVAWALFAINGVAYAVLWVLTLIRLIRWPRRLFGDMVDHRRGPGFFTMNQNVSRIFTFKEGKIKFQLVGEAFNLTNTVVFSNPNTTCCWVPRADGTTNYNNFAVITGTASSPRQLQVGGYLRF